MIEPAVADAIDLSRVRRVLVIKLRHHGDVLLASPVFTALHRAVPHAELDALVYLETVPMLAGHPAIAEVHAIDRGLRKRGPIEHAMGELALWRRLRERRYDLVVHLTDHPRGAWLARLVGARHAVAPERRRNGWLWRRCFTHRYLLPLSTPRHAVEQNLDALRRIGLWPEEADKPLVMAPDAATRARADALLAANGLVPGRFILVHPGSRWMFKCWPAAPTAALLDKLADAGWRIVLTGAPDPAEAKLIAAIKATMRTTPVDLSGQLTLPELRVLIGRARLFIGCDTAPMHMASAAGTPVVAWFGPSGEIEWGPWRVPHRVVASDVHPCRPCGNNGCGGSNNSECLIMLPLSRVEAAVASLLAETGTVSPQ